MSVDTTEALDSPEGGQGPRPSLRTVILQSSNVWRISFTVIAAIAVALFLRFILEDGGNVIFTVLMSWFASIAMAPAVDRLSRRMRRGVATMIVMLGFIIFAVFFTLIFGQLLLEQVVQLIQSLPEVTRGAVDWVNQTFSLTLDIEAIKEQVGLTPDNVSQIAQEVGGEALGILGSVVGSVFSLFTFGLFTFYLSADSPRLRRWIATLFPAQAQAVVLNIWDITAEKTGGYVGARVVLAFINGSTTAVVFLLIGMPNWLALSIWTGIVAQFVPTIGTYIAIILPVIVGLLSGNPIVGVLALVWALLYQQVENLTIEPKISARAVDVHPAVAFGSVMMGAALFGVAGAFLAVPVTAMLLALLGIYMKRHTFNPDRQDEDSEDSEDDDLETDTVHG
jgi:predicted PurR-regulated permease PerM